MATGANIVNLSGGRNYYGSMKVKHPLVVVLAALCSYIGAAAPKSNGELVFCALSNHSDSCAILIIIMAQPL